jgi:Fibronectin type III domain
MPPVGVDAVSSSSSSVVVSWADTPSQGGFSYGGLGDGRVYTVRYGQRSMRGRYRYVNVTSTNARIDDLRPDTEYELSVKVSRSTRHSTWSMSVFVRTREAGKSEQ